jgi:hypothetical protein
MRWEIAYSSALVLGILSSAQAFVNPSIARQATAKTPLFVGGLGWDNENFLEALGGNKDAQEDANEKYYKHSKFGKDVPGAKRDDDDKYRQAMGLDRSEDDELPEDGPSEGLTDEMKAKMKASHGDEDTQGGDRLKSLMDRAQSGANLRPPSTPPAPSMQPDMYQPESPSMSPNDLSVEEQARLFREMQQQQQQQGSFQSMPPPLPGPRQPYGNEEGSNGRRVGRNRDADAMVNTADVYFAQLKRDSTVRQTARYRGDLDTANSVFSDPSISDIKMHVNPHLEEIRRKEQEMIETATDEMLSLAAPTVNRPVKPKGYSGVSYRDKIQQFKNKKGGAAAVTPVVKPVAQAAVEAPPVVAPAPAPPVQQAPPVVQAPVQAPPVVQAPVQAPPAVQAPPKVPEPVMQEAPVAPNPVVPEQATAAADTMRGSIRTLMGMLLKHRGGPGFGPGRLTGADVNSYDQLSMDVAAILRDEARNSPSLGEPAVFAQMAAVAAAKQQAAAPAPSVTADVAIPMKNAQPAGERIDGMIGCIEGATQMYKNSPPELQEGILVMLRAALLSAVNTCNDLIANPMVTAGGAIQPKTAQPVGERINSMIGCIEGATQMYKNSPPELQEGILVMLRAALLSAVHTCNDIIANNEVANVQAYQTATSDVQAPAPSTPMQVYDAVQVQEEVTAQPSPVASTATDTNSQVLEQVYNKLKAAAGDGKMGLRKGLNPKDASELADSIAEMRSMLVDELTTGIPEGEAGAPSEGEAGAPSKYQQMLAKARADKEAKNGNN